MKIVYAASFVSDAILGLLAALGLSSLSTTTEDDSNASK